MEDLSALVKEMALNLGAGAVGFLTKETLEGGPPSTDLSYVLPAARSAICLALPMDQRLIEPFLGKTDHRAHNLDNLRTNTLADGIALEITAFLKQKGFDTVAVPGNLEYRTETKNGIYDEKPPIAHRYLAVRSGIGHFGHSGNVIMPRYGAAIVLAAVVTAAELVSTDPLPEAENYCDDCRLCHAACASGYMSQDEKVSVTLGDYTFTYSQRRHHSRCDYVCGGFTGLHRSGKWSTWSPARFPIPEADEDFLPALVNSLKPFLKRPSDSNRFFSILVPGHRVEFTCGNCMLVCHPDRKVREKRYQLLRNAGVIIQHPDGKREAVSPEAAQLHIAALPSEKRALYEIVD